MGFTLNHLCFLIHTCRNSSLSEIVIIFFIYIDNIFLSCFFIILIFNSLKDSLISYYHFNILNLIQICLFKFIIPLNQKFSLFGPDLSIFMILCQYYILLSNIHIYLYLQYLLFNDNHLLQ